MPPLRSSRPILAATVMVLAAAGCKSSSAPNLSGPGWSSVSTDVVAISARPYGLALNADRAFVTQLDAGTVTRANLSSAPGVDGSFSTGFIPTGVAVTPAGDLALVASQDGRVTLHSAPSGELLTTFNMQGSPFRALVSKDGSRGFALSSVGQLLIVNLATRAVVGTVSTGLNATNGLALNGAGNVAYVTAMSGGIVAVDLGTRTVTRRYDVYGTLQDVVADPSGLDLLVADEGGSVIKLNLASGLTQRVAVPNAFGLALGPDNSQLWVTQPGAGKLTVLDVATGMSVRSIALNDGNSTPRRVAFNGAGAAVVTDERGFLHVIR